MLNLSINLFDESSFDKAISELERYRNDLQTRADLIRERVAERIRWSAEEGFSTSIADAIFLGGTEQVGGNVTVTISDEGTVTVVIASGADAVFMEFGAGVYFNGGKGAIGHSSHPSGERQGMTIGEYGKKRGRQNAWHLPGSTKDNPIVTRGTPASMPMYRGAREAAAALDEIAREVFGA